MVCLSVGLSVCLSVCHCKNGLSVRDAVSDIMTQVGARNHVLVEVQMPNMKGQF